MGRCSNVDPAAFKTGIDVNVMGVFNTVRAALPSVIDRRGCVLVVSSLAAYAPIAGSGVLQPGPRPGSSTSPTRCAWRWPTTGSTSVPPTCRGSTPHWCGTAPRSSPRCVPLSRRCRDRWSKITSVHSRRGLRQGHRAAPTAHQLPGLGGPVPLAQADPVDPGGAAAAAQGCRPTRPDGRRNSGPAPECPHAELDGR